ncbi:MAG: FAD-binding protein [Bifidobacteriaceae bacterium]|nr:FAD-binding protein [Bifidobacteriaceae bacterium]
MTPTKQDLHYDAVIIGAGAAGLSCALGIMREWENIQTSPSPKGSAANPPRVLVISKLQPLRSHTGSAEGGIAASLSTIEHDTWQWHYRDTVKGGDWLVDQDAAKILAQEAPETVIRLEHDGVAFSRTPDGHIAQRKFGGHTADGERPVKRVAYAADRIGHQILHTLWQQCQRYAIDFADEWYVTDLVLSTNDVGSAGAANRRAAGVIVLDEATGKLHSVEAPAIVVATGGAGRLFHTTSNSWDLTGDGMGLALSSGLQLEDSEFIQFHPTGLAHTGILLSEAARGEGGTLRNAAGEAFMQRYAPGVGDLAARDVVARAINHEVAEGRGVNDPLSPDSPADCVWLDLRSIGRERLDTALPEVCDTIREFAGLDPATDLVPVKPTAHYTMGGIPVDTTGSVYTVNFTTGAKTVVAGLKAAGECSCISVHGANRLGANSLLDAVVFGTRSGSDIARTLGHSAATGTDMATDTAASRAALCTAYNARQESVTQLLHQALPTTPPAALPSAASTDPMPDNPYQLMRDVGIMMEAHLGVTCTAESITEAINQLREVFLPRAEKLRTHDATAAFNQELCAILEARNLVRVSLALATATASREESRGSLYRADFPERDDAHFLAHSFVNAHGEISYRPVVIEDYPPERRSY